MSWVNFYTGSVPWLNGNLALAEKFSGPLRFRLRQVLLYYVNTHSKLIYSQFLDSAVFIP